MCSNTGGSTANRLRLRPPAEQAPQSWWPVPSGSGCATLPGAAPVERRSAKRASVPGHRRATAPRRLPLRERPSVAELPLDREPAKQPWRALPPELGQPQDLACRHLWYPLQESAVPMCPGPARRQLKSPEPPLERCRQPGVAAPHWRPTQPATDSRALAGQAQARLSYPALPSVPEQRRELEHHRPKFPQQLSGHGTRAAAGHSALILLELDPAQGHPSATAPRHLKSIRSVTGFLRSVEPGRANWLFPVKAVERGIQPGQALARSWLRGWAQVPATQQVMAHCCLPLRSSGQVVVNLPAAVRRRWKSRCSATEAIGPPPPTAPSPPA